MKFTSQNSRAGGTRPERAEDQYDDFIGHNNTARYLAKFEQFDRHRAAGMRWHWPAFFITFYWLIYRKMWLLAVAYSMMPLVFGVALALLSRGMPSSGAMAAVVALAFVLPALFADAVYYKVCRRRILAARAQTRDPLAQRRQIAQRGGTSWIAVIVVIVLQVVLGSIAHQLEPKVQSRVAPEVAR
ncbi:MAG: DUF2628 domain-containing protein [Gammaproteobacteria bacterium]|nr:DUF2628 domain-containing protein [Gammaproteobacteria bacterium]MBU1443611.1 DUF2628 domain-containing protein [Gammaproteobacteria bacterium]MBU2407971.1 DUF2628 domain-containing protein [Gammaproteobacteria bacterium]